MWRNHLNPLGSKGVIERITAIGTLPNNSSGLSHGDNFIEGRLDKGDFMREQVESVCTASGRPEASAITISFVPLPRLVFPTFAPLFFATTNVPSMKHSERLMAPRSSRSRASASRIFRNRPALLHLLNRR